MLSVPEEGGPGAAAEARAEITLLPTVKPMVMQGMSTDGGADIGPAAHRVPHTEAAGYVLKRSVTPCRAHVGAGS